VPIDHSTLELDLAATVRFLMSQCLQVSDLFSGVQAMSLALKIPPLALLLLSVAAMAALAKLVNVFQFASQPVAAIVLLSLGFWVAAIGVYEFNRVSTTVNPRNPEASSSLVDSGVYRFSRNPMYVGLVLCLLAWGLWLGQGLGFMVPVIFIVYMNYFQIIPEERALLASFGEPYGAYLSRVRRWV